MTGETVTRIRAGEQTGVDRYGNPVYGPDVETLIEGAFFDPGSSNELIVVGGVPMTTTPTLYFPGRWPDLVADDRVQVRGVEYHVDGRPGDWRSPWGSNAGGLVVTLRLAEGGGT